MPGLRALVALCALKAGEVGYPLDVIRLGINEGINSSVVVLDGDRLRYAVQEERLRRVKNYMGFPTEAVRRALADLGLSPRDVGRVCLSNLVSYEFDKDSFLAEYEKRARTPFERLQHADQEDLPGIARRWLRRDPGAELTRAKTAGERYCQRHLGALGLGDTPQVRRDHHLLHAAAAYFGCRADHERETLVLTLDGGGDQECSAVYRAQRGRLELLARTPQGNSLGNVYSTLTHHLGFTPHEHEYKLMGLAAYSDGSHTGAVESLLASYLDLDPQNPLRFKRKVPEPTWKLGRRYRRELERVRFDNAAAGLQRFCEDLLVRWVRACVRETGIGDVVCAGGVFMNVKANKLIAELPEVERFDVFPSCGDETLPFGGVWLDRAEEDPERGAALGLDTIYLGPRAEADLQDALAELPAGVEVRQLSDPAEEIAELLARGTIVARCCGPMEFGARALGNRSILADPSAPGVVHWLNKAIKRRDFWMPFAPILRREDAGELLRVPDSLPERISPYMMHTFETAPARREELAAAVHAYDKTARAQVVGREDNPPLHAILSAFKARTGRGALLNTSFNLHGYPIVTGTRDALEVLTSSGLTHLVVGDRLFVRVEEQGSA